MSFIIFVQIKDLPRPSFMSKTLKELKIGTYDNVITVSIYNCIYFIYIYTSHDRYKQMSGYAGPLVLAVRG